MGQKWRKWWHFYSSNRTNLLSLAGLAVKAYIALKTFCAIHIFPPLKKYHCNQDGALIFFFNSYFFALNLQNQRNKQTKKPKWSKIQYKLLKMSTLNIFYVLHMANNTEQRSIPGGWWLCWPYFAFSRLQNMASHKHGGPPPPTPSYYPQSHTVH